MRLIKFSGLIAVFGMVFPFAACAPADPDLNPEPKTPPSASSQNPWNRPISGQGAGPMGSALPNQMRR